MPIGEKISALRKRKGISQELLAENSRTSLRTIQRIERGTTSPRPYTLKAIADALSVSVEEIAPGSPTKPGSEELTPLKFINSSALIVLVLPPMNILLPLLIWRKHKHLPTVDITGRKIISFQILWTISTIMILLGAQLLQLSITGSARVGHFPMLLLVYFLMLGLNIFFIVLSAFQIKTDVSRVLRFLPTLF